MRRNSWRRSAVGMLAALALSGCGTGGPKRLPPLEPGPEPADRRPTPGRLVLPALLQVGLAENADSVLATADGPALVLDGETGLTLARLDRGRLRCRRSGGEVLWDGGGGSGAARAVVLQPIDPSHLLQSLDQSYRGEFLVIPSPKGGGLTLVNGVDLEAYLRGVVPWEIGRHPPDKLAAVQAQAVAARTYTISHLGARRDHGFDVFADVMDQVYKGAAGEDPLCDEAVASTAGQVLRHDGREIEAYYSACCGGVSSNVEEVWARAASPYLTSRRDGPGRDGRAFCAASKYYSWNEVWSVNGLTAILAETLPEYLDYVATNGRSAWAGPAFSPRRGGADPRRPGRLQNLEILRRTTSGRVADLAVTTEAGTYHVRGDRTRWVLRPADGNPFILRSAMFDLELTREGGALTGIRATGNGFGHGIGLCQTGALAMAAEGHDLRAILNHYYPGARLESVGGPR